MTRLGVSWQNCDWSRRFSSSSPALDFSLPPVSNYILKKLARYILCLLYDVREKKCLTLLQRLITTKSIEPQPGEPRPQCFYLRQPWRFPRCSNWDSKAGCRCSGRKKEKKKHSSLSIKYKMKGRLEICQEIYTTKFSAERILHTENA